MRLWVGVTDQTWFEYLATRRPDEVNFWQPSGSLTFRSLQAGELFLFKLHAPNNYIVGGGVYIRYSSLPCSLAWDAFGEKNGVDSTSDFLERIRKYRHRPEREPDPVIGCNLLAAPFFFDEADWIPVPKNFAPNIVRGRTYDLSSAEGRELYDAVAMRMRGRMEDYFGVPQGSVGENCPPMYWVEGRLGQGTFRVSVVDAYQRRCAVTGERTLPVLEAAHIRPYKKNGPNRISNGLLLRSDLHKLFDLGYLTITTDLRVEVSKRIKEEFENGREYYHFHGERLLVLPGNRSEMPSSEFLGWHNENVFVP